MSDPIMPPQELINTWRDQWNNHRIGDLGDYLARSGAAWAQQTRRRSLLERARDELDTVGLHEALGDFSLKAVREVVELYGSDH